MGMVEIKPPFCLIATFSPIISVLINTALVVSFRNPVQSVTHSLRDGREQGMDFMDWSRGSNYIKIQSQSLSFSISLSLSLSLILSLLISHLSYKELELVLWKVNDCQEYHRLNSYWGEESHRIPQSCFCVLSMQLCIWFCKSFNFLIYTSKWYLK